MPGNQKITTFLWFNDNNAEEAMNFYCSIFKNSKIIERMPHNDATPGPTGSLLCGTFQLEGQQFMAMNGGSDVKFNQSVSLLVNCQTQQEVDQLWDQLLAGGGKPIACGWLQDKFGLSWQVTPRRLLELMSDPDPKKATAVARAMMEMVKIDIAALEAAYAAA